jgi:hypothetical protein
MVSPKTIVVKNAVLSFHQRGLPGLHPKQTKTQKDAGQWGFRASTLAVESQ